MALSFIDVLPQLQGVLRRFGQLARVFRQALEVCPAARVGLARLPARALRPRRDSGSRCNQRPPARAPFSKSRAPITKNLCKRSPNCRRRRSPSNRRVSWAMRPSLARKRGAEQTHLEISQPRRKASPPQSPPAPCRLSTMTGVARAAREMVLGSRALSSRQPYSPRSTLSVTSMAFVTATCPSSARRCCRVFHQRDMEQYAFKDETLRIFQRSSTRTNFAPGRTRNRYSLTASCEKESRALLAWVAVAARRCGSASSGDVLDYETSSPHRVIGLAGGFP